MRHILDKYINQFLNIIIETITNRLKNLESTSLSTFKSIFLIITIISLLLILLKIFFDKKEVLAFKLPLIQISFNYLLVNLLFIIIDKTNIYIDIYNYYKDINQNNFLLIVFLVVILIMLIDQLKTIIGLMAKSFSSLYAFLDIPKMSNNLKENIVDICEEVISVFFLHFALSNNLNIFFVFLLILSLKEFSRKLKSFMFAEMEEIITN